MSFGDVISQLAIEKRHKTGTYEVTRTFRFLGFGMLFAVSEFNGLSLLKDNLFI